MLCLARFSLARAARASLPLAAHVRPLELERLAAVELYRVAPGRLVALRSAQRVEVGMWSTSTAYKNSMFRNCPGSIAGKTNNGWGTPV